jgi:hypothetical protein
MFRFALVSITLVSVLQSVNDPPQLRLIAPVRIGTNEPLKLGFEVTNRGEHGFYFKVPWKWAPNGMHVVATATDGRVYTTSSLLYDIASDSVCTHFKAVGPYESFRFEQSFARTEWAPQFQLPPGSYVLRWTYDAAHYEGEAKCAAAGWPIWKGRIESEAVRMDVTP